MHADSAPSRARFGPYAADFRERVLRKDGRLIKLQAKPLAVLQLLVRRQGEIVSREELRHALWPGDVFVDFDKNLGIAIAKLRAALGDSANSPRYIETVPRRGYRFLAPVEVVAQASLPIEPPGRGEVPSSALSNAAPATLPSRIVGSGGFQTRPYQPATGNGKRSAFPFAEHRAFWTGAATGVAAVLALLAPVAFWPGKSKPAPKRVETIVLGDFRNSTPDAVFDTALRQGLWSQLEQSPDLHLLSNTRIRRTLALMERPANTFLSPGVARRVCERNDGAATIGGSISRMGNQYVIGLSAVACPTGSVLAEEEVTAGHKSRILAALYKASKTMRQKLGESLASVRKYSAPLEDVTTNSLHALQAYSIGYHILTGNNDSHPAIPFFLRAVRLDPNFAMAYAMLGKSYQADQQESLGAEYFTKAYRLRRHASAPERFLIEAYYELIARGDLPAAEGIFKVWARTYPADYLPHAALGTIYVDLGEFRRSLAERQIALKLDPGIGLNYGNLEMSLVWLHRYKQAFALAREAQARGMNSPEIQLAVAWIPWSEGKLAERDQWLAPVSDDPNLAQRAMEEEAAMGAYAGQMARARALTRTAIQGFRRVGRPGAGLQEEARLAVDEALVGDFAHATALAQAALSKDVNRKARAGAAIAFALAGNTKEASLMADRLSAEYPDATDVQRNFVPAIRAAVALRNGRPEHAILALAPAAAYQVSDLGFAFLPLYLHGMAFLAMKNGAQASREFAKLVGNCSAFAFLTCSLSRLHLARACALMGETKKAKSEYADFFALWEGADPGIPVLTGAKMAYAELRGAKPRQSLAKLRPVSAACGPI